MRDIPGLKKTQMRLSVSLVITLAALLPARAELGECFVAVEGRPIIDGICSYSLRGDGSFTIGSPARNARGFALLRDGTGSGRAFWNGELRGPISEPLGRVTPRGACWENQRASICVWRVGTRVKPRDVTSCDQVAGFPFDPNRVSAGVMYEGLQPGTAIPACSDAVNRSPTNGRFWFQLGRSLERAVRLTEAIDAYGTARRLGHPGGSNNLGELYRQGKGLPKNQERAEALFREAAEMGYPEGAFNLASTLLRKGSYDLGEVRAALNVAAFVGYPGSKRMLASLEPLGTNGDEPAFAFSGTDNSPPNTNNSAANTVSSADAYQQPPSAPIPAPDQVRQPVAVASSQPTVSSQSLGQKAQVTPEPERQAPITNSPQSKDAKITEQLDSLAKQIDLLSRVLADQQAKLTSGDADIAAAAQGSTTVITSRMASLKNDFDQKVAHVPGYSTPVRPTDKDLYLSARKESELYPRVPYFIPGTPETGEFWVEPHVTDDGTLQFRFRFVDPQSMMDKTRDQINLSIEDAELVQNGLTKLASWSKTAHENRLRRKFEKRIVCFPAPNCPADGERLDGKSSTEVRFAVNDDGSTEGRLQRNKGRFIEGYNFSIESGALLQSYMTFIINIAKLDFTAGASTRDDLDKMFR